MKKLLFAAATGALLVAAVPASAQLYFGADPDGAGIQTGPFGLGVGPRCDRYPDGYADEYGAPCPLVRERIVTSSGRVIFRTRPAC
jgi:hypothetical protein